MDKNIIYFDNAATSWPKPEQTYLAADAYSRRVGGSPGRSGHRLSIEAGRIVLEARLLPGSRRTDEPVYNVPGLGKNHLRAFQHRDLISVLPNGARVYDFHPWEKGIVPCEPYAGADVPILDYLQRLQDTDEDPDEYETIWYYY